MEEKIVLRRKEQKQESLLLPEYREGGYFTSPEFKKIEAEVDETLFETGIDIKDFE